jgi:hypothetical protein
MLDNLDIIVISNLLLLNTYSYTYLTNFLIYVQTSYIYVYIYICIYIYIYTGSAKKCIHTLTYGVCVLFSKLN